MASTHVVVSVLLALALSATVLAAPSSEMNPVHDSESLCGGGPCGGGSHYSVVGELVPHEKGKGLQLKGGALSVDKYDGDLAAMKKQLSQSRRLLRSLVLRIKTQKIQDKDAADGLARQIDRLRGKNRRLRQNIRNAKLKRGPTGNPGRPGPTGLPGPQGYQGRQGPPGHDGFTGPIGRRGRQGPAGVAGAPGAAGRDGLPGPTGSRGPRGPRGRTGYPGPRGPRGITGNPGLEGARGPIGIEGPRGPTGFRGPTGPRGPRGPSGAPGPVGPNGKTGAPGARGQDGRVGLRGPTGKIGPIGLRGPTGLQGPRGHRGATGKPGSVGLAGPQGVRGDTGLPGSTGPAGPRGRPGPPGRNGSNGRNGAPGKHGANGLNGSPGPRGKDGRTGKTGPRGPTGLRGRPGKDGARGPAGYRGRTGPAGASGARGPPGPAGARGPSTRAIVRTVRSSSAASSQLRRLQQQVRQARQTAAAVRAVGKAVRTHHTITGVRPNVRPLVLRQSKDKVAVTGSVINYLTNGHVHQVKVVIKRNGKKVKTVESNGNGRWAAMLKPGKYRAYLKKEGFVGPSVGFELKKGQRTETVVTGMSPAMPGNSVRFVLIWGDHPADLDSHLNLPGNRCKVIYYNKVCKNYGVAQLDIDATRGHGPETVTISVPKEGSYEYNVHQYSNDGNFKTSEGKVLVFTGKKVVVLRAEKAAAGDKRHGIIEGKLWKAFKWVVDKNGKGKLKRYN